MIFDLILIIFLQPLFGSLFFLLPSILFDFFQEKERIYLKIILFTFLSDLIFLKPLGFFLMLTSFSLFLISFLEKLISDIFFYQRIIYLIFFNLIFFSLFLFLNFKNINFNLLINLFFFNMILQTIFIEIKRLIK